MKLVKPKYSIPSRKYFSENIIPRIYNETKLKIKTAIQDATAISVTTDLWTNTNNQQSFLNFSAHWLDDNFNFQHAVLQIKHFLGSHTGENIKQYLEEIRALWEIDQNKIHAIVRDNGRNVVKAIEDSVFSPVACFILTLQLVINDALKNGQNIIKEAISKSRRIVTHFHHSGSA